MGISYRIGVFYLAYLIKINVNGPNADPVYKFLKESTDGAEVGWNFHKFILVDGKPIHRFASKLSPKKIENEIIEHLAGDVTDAEDAYEYVDEGESL